MKDKNKFYKDAARFFDAGVMREIYSDDKVCICNVADQCYCAFNYLTTKNGQLGIIINSRLAELIVNNSKSLDIYISTLNKGELGKMSMYLDDRRFELMKKLKQTNSVTGPKNDINYQFEEELGQKKRRM